MFKPVFSVAVAVFCWMTGVVTEAHAAGGDVYPQRVYGAGGRFESMGVPMQLPGARGDLLNGGDLHYSSEFGLVPGSGCLPSDDMYRILPYPAPTDRGIPRRSKPRRDDYGGAVRPVPTTPDWRRDLAGEWQNYRDLGRSPDRGGRLPASGSPEHDLFDNGNPSFLEGDRLERAPLRGQNDGTRDSWFDDDRGLRDRLSAPRDERYRNRNEPLPSQRDDRRVPNRLELDFERDLPRNLPGLTPINYEFPLPASPVEPSTNGNASSPFYQ